MYKCNGQYHNSINILIFHISSKFFLLSFIDDDSACLDTQLNWTCPGGYLKVHSAIWKTVKNCERTFNTFETHDVVMHMQNKCNNKATCVFTARDSSFGVSCSDTCSRLDYTYTCVSKSLVVLHYFNKETLAIIGQTNNSGRYTSCKASTMRMAWIINMIMQINHKLVTKCYTPNSYEYR